MGCASSKRIEVAAVDVYRPAPASFAVFDVSAIEEPWLKGGGGGGDADNSNDEKASHLPKPILEKLKAFEDAPRSWEEVSKALEDLKPKLNEVAPDSGDKQPSATPLPAQDSGSGDDGGDANKGNLPRKNFSFHTLEELEAKISSKPAETKADSKSKPDLKRFQSAKTEIPNITTNGEVPKSLRDNIFIVRDRLEREKEGKPVGFVKRDPLGDFEELCPPGGENSVVVYTTSLGGVRRTYEDCNRVKQLMETHQVVFDERDVALDGGFLIELRGLLGEGAAVPAVFVKGRYIGGAEEVVGLNETGRLRRIMNWARIERGVGRMGCRGCGGARFVPCLDCGGSCKVVVGENRERCGVCNENGLVHCPICI